MDWSVWSPIVAGIRDGLGGCALVVVVVAGIRNHRAHDPRAKARAKAWLSRPFAKRR